MGTKLEISTCIYSSSVLSKLSLKHPAGRRKVSQPKPVKPSSVHKLLPSTCPWAASSYSRISEWHHWLLPPKSAVNWAHFLTHPNPEHSRIHSVLLHRPSPPLLYSETLPPCPVLTPPQHCCQSNFSRTKSDYVPSLFRILVSRIKCKIFPRTYKVLFMIWPPTTFSASSEVVPLYILH